MSKKPRDPNRRSDADDFESFDDEERWQRPRDRFPTLPDEPTPPPRRRRAPETEREVDSVDPTRVEAELKYEAPYEDPTSAERFPHLFGPLNLDAVIAAHPFEPGADGSFELPEKLG